MSMKFRKSTRAEREAGRRFTKKERISKLKGVVQRKRKVIVEKGGIFDLEAKERKRKIERAKAKIRRSPKKKKAIMKDFFGDK